MSGKVMDWAFTLLLVLLLLTFYLLSRWGKSVSQALLAHPTEKRLWIPAAFAAVSFLVAALFTSLFFLTLGGIACVALWLVSYMFNTADHTRFEKPLQLSAIISPSSWFEAA